MSQKFIDIDKIVDEKNPNLRKWVPKFFFSYLKKIVRQKEVNQILEETKDLEGYEFCVEIIKRFNIKIKTHGLNNIPKTGGAIFAANHPLGGIDALAIVKEVTPIRPDIKFVVNDILLHLKNLNKLFIGVNKHGTNTKTSLAALNQEFDSDQAIFVFPAGLVSRKQKGTVKDTEWKKTFISRSKKFKKDVIPVFLDGELSNFFYNLSNFRQRIGIKANIEMLYLVNEMFKLKNKTYHLHFGSPIPHSTFDKSKSDAEWAEYVKTSVYNLKHEN